MAAIKYKVELTEAERSRLNEVSQRGKASVRTVKRALSLLKADQGLRDREIADVLLVNAATVARARKRYVEEGQLPENFRCPPQVVDVANKLVRRNLARDVGKADLIANKTSQSKGVIRLRPFRSFEDEAEWVANDIKSRPTESQADCVVLGRSRRLLEPVMNALIDNGVPSFIATRKGEFHPSLRRAKASF